MSLKDTITADMKSALLGGRRFEGDVLRNIRAAILDAEVAAGKRETGLSDDEIVAVLLREAKKRKESIAIYTENGRADLAEAEQAELHVIQPYLPQMLTEQEIASLVDEVLQTISAQGPQDMGKVIGVVKQRAGAQADGALVAKVVKQRLMQ